MIDIEADVYDIVYQRAVQKYPHLFMTGEYVKSPPSFPCASLVESDNAAYLKTQSSDSVENHAEVMFELSVYSNKTKGRKAECREIMVFLDGIMGNLGFTRTMMNPVPNLNDATIYRMVARYKAVVSNDKKIYRR